jgi:hypothetical protein
MPYAQHAADTAARPAAPAHLNLPPYTVEKLPATIHIKFVFVIPMIKAIRAGVSVRDSLIPSIKLM